MKKNLKIIFVGIPDMALICLENLLKANFNIIGVVPPKKNHETYYYFSKFVLEKGLNLIEFEKSPNEKNCIDKIKALEADIGVICSYNDKLSKDFINTTKLGYINCHPSLLPYYRGAAPYFHIVNNGEKISGITLHFIDEKFDSGDIIYQEKFDLLPNETMGTIFNRTTYMLSDALIKILDKINSNEEIKRYPQPKGNFVKAPHVEGSFKINWSDDVFKIERLIRATNPFYNVWTKFRGVGVKIISASAISQKHDEKNGTIVKADNNTLLVAAGGGY